MWEITLIGERDDYFDLKEYCDILIDIFVKDIIVAIDYDDKVYVSIATSRDGIIKFVENTIYEIIIKINKKNFFYNNLNKSFKEKVLLPFIISSIISIDLNDEIDFAKNSVKLTSVINIKSFVYFKLKSIVSKWSKIVKYLNYTYFNKINDELYLQFLKFISENNQTLFDVIFLQEYLNDMLFIDKNGNKLISIPLNDEIGIIVNLIIYSPKKLIINGDNSLSKKINGLISYIFRDRLCVVL